MSRMKLDIKKEDLPEFAQEVLIDRLGFEIEIWDTGYVKLFTHDDMIRIYSLSYRTPRIYGWDGKTMHLDHFKDIESLDLVEQDFIDILDHEVSRLVNTYYGSDIERMSNIIECNLKSRIVEELKNQRFQSMDEAKLDINHLVRYSIQDSMDNIDKLWDE